MKIDALAWVTAVAAMLSAAAAVQGWLQKAGVAKRAHIERLSVRTTVWSRAANTVSIVVEFKMDDVHELPRVKVESLDKIGRGLTTQTGATLRNSLNERYGLRPDLQLAHGVCELMDQGSSPRDFYAAFFLVTTAPIRTVRLRVTVAGDATGKRLARRTLVCSVKS